MVIKYIIAPFCSPVIECLYIYVKNLYMQYYVVGTECLYYIIKKRRYLTIKICCRTFNNVSIYC